jgi:hypothetical protein
MLRSAQCSRKMSDQIAPSKTENEKSSKIIIVGRPLTN